MELIMSDAYGTITFSKSNDCIIDSLMLVEALNQFNWSNDGSDWMYSEDNETIRITSSRIQYPVAIPEFDEYIHVKNNDGTWTTYDAKEADDSIFDQICSATSAPYSLEELSRRLSPHIKNGWIEISCNANEKARYSYFQSLRIYSNGITKKRNIWSGPNVDPIDEKESYEPDSKSHI